MLTQIDPDQALELVLSESRYRKVEPLELADALDLVLAEDIYSDRDYPPFDRAMMDGYAIRMADIGKAVRLIGEVAAGEASSTSVQAGTCVSIMTGAACPNGTEAVVKREVVRVEGQEVLLPKNIKKSQFMVLQGKECVKGGLAVAQGTLVTPLVIGILSSIGQLKVKVFTPPRVAVITTGRELISVNETPGLVTIRNSNGPMLRAQMRRLGLDDPLLLHAMDTPESLASCLKRSIEADIIVLTGGVSMGRYDLVPRAVMDIGAKPIFHKVTQKPGKPLLFAKMEEKLFFGLPGHPLSSHFCFHRYVASSVRKVMGKRVGVTLHYASLTTELEVASDRTVFLQGCAEHDGQGWVLTPMVGQGSADLFSVAESNAYFRLPEGQHYLSEGADVEFELISSSY